MRVLAFDIGATYGWAIGYSTAPEKIDDYRQDFASGERPERFRRFGVAVDRLMERRRPDLVVYERPFARGDAATRSLWGQAAIIEMSANRWGAAVFDAAPPVTIKKWFTGNHQASKDAMMAEARKRLGLAPDAPLGEHEADAVAVCLYTLAHLEPAEKK